MSAPTTKRRPSWPPPVTRQPARRTVSSRAPQRQILAEKQAAQISLRSEVGLLASELAEKIIGEQLTDTALTSRVVDRFLDELEADSELVEEKR